MGVKFKNSQCSITKVPLRKLKNNCFFILKQDEPIVRLKLKECVFDFALQRCVDMDENAEVIPVKVNEVAFSVLSENEYIDF